MKGMDKKQLDEIRARCEASTPGTWTMAGDTDYIGDGTEIFSVVEDMTKRVIGAIMWDGKAYVALLKTDALFITRARNDIPALLDEVGRLRAENERLSRRV